MSNAPGQNDPTTIRTYGTSSIEVTFDARRCLHAAECVRGLPAVFDTARRPWVQPDRASAEAIAEVIHRCPSGALRYARLDGEGAEIPETTTRVRADPDGPISVRGDLVISTPSGVTHETRVTLCGCGRSANAPFCDNTHRTPTVERIP